MRNIKKKLDIYIYIVYIVYVESEGLKTKKRKGSDMKEEKKVVLVLDEKGEKWWEDGGGKKINCLDLQGISNSLTGADGGTGIFNDVVYFDAGGEDEVGYETKYTAEWGKYKRTFNGSQWNVENYAAVEAEIRQRIDAVCEWVHECKARAFRREMEF